MRRVLHLAAVLAVVVAAASCTTSGVTTPPWFSAPVNGVETGYASGCNTSSQLREFIVLPSHPVYYEYTVEGQPGAGGSGWTVDGSQREGFSSGQNLALTQKFPQGTCVNMVLYDLDALGFFTYTATWHLWCCAPGG